MGFKEGNKGTQCEWEIRDHIGIIRYNNPPLNINSMEMTALFQEACGIMEKDSDVKVVVLTHNGRAFCAGTNLHQIIKQFDTNTYVYPKMLQSITAGDAFANLRMPTICALDGSAYQGGFERVLQCDLVIARPEVELVMTGADLGTWPGGGGTPRLLRLMGTKKLMEFLLINSKMTAAQAMEYGIVNALAEEGSAFDKAMEWAEIIASHPTISSAAVKEAIVGYYKPMEEYLKNMQMIINQKIYNAGDLQQGCRAFFEKQEAKKRARAAAQTGGNTDDSKT